MKKVIIIIFGVLIHLLPTFAQKETAIWHFGRYSGMDFNQLKTVTNATINGVANQTITGVPTFVPGPINTYEGCFSICDKDGNLLFSSDGRFVYDKNGTRMPHGSGLKGDASATQSGIVIPRPGSPNRYFIITAPAGEGPRNPLHYYEVDMTLNGGKGDVIGPYTGMIPNGTFLTFPSSHYINTEAYENVAAVGHANGKDFWLAHRCRNQFYIWLVTKDGISQHPTKSFAIGSDPGSIFVSHYVVPGYLKFSSDGKYIAVSNSMVAKTLHIAKFDTNTGDISDIKQKVVPIQPYGISFSPSNKYLYYTHTYTGPLYRISVDKLMNGIAETPTLIAAEIANIQVSADNRMYGIVSYWHTPATSDRLYILDDLDEATPTIAYIPNYFNKTTNGSHLSLPTFTSSFFALQDLEMTPPNGCSNQELTFSAQINAGTGLNAITKIEWDFGDGTPIVSDTNMNQLVHTQKHTYSEAGKYTFKLTPYKADGSVLTEKIKTEEIVVGSCMIPANHNITNMGY